MPAALPVGVAFGSRHIHIRMCRTFPVRSLRMSESQTTLADILSQFSAYLPPEDLLQITGDVIKKFPLDFPITPRPEMSLFKLDRSDPDHPVLRRGGKIVEELDTDDELLDHPKEWVAMKSLSDSLALFQKRHPKRAAAMCLRFQLHLLMDMHERGHSLEGDLMLVVISGLRMAIDNLDPRDVDSPGSTSA